MVTAAAVYCRKCGRFLAEGIVGSSAFCPRCRFWTDIREPAQASLLGGDP